MQTFYQLFSKNNNYFYKNRGFNEPPCLDLLIAREFLVNVFADCSLAIAVHIEVDIEECRPTSLYPIQILPEDVFCEAIIECVVEEISYLIVSAVHHKEHNLVHTLY